MVEEISPAVLLDPPNPVMIVNERVFRECGCCMYAGMRVDKMEPASSAIACSDDHEQAIMHFNLLLRESLLDPQERPLTDVADELMEKAFGYYGIE